MKMRKDGNVEFNQAVAKSLMVPQWDSEVIEEREKLLFALAKAVEECGHIRVLQLLESATELPHDSAPAQGGRDG